MEVKLCDRCGTPIEKTDNERDIVRISRYIPSEFSYINLDFCPTCRSSLVDWLGNKEEFDAERTSHRILEKIFKKEEEEFMKQMKKWENE